MRVLVTERLAQEYGGKLRAVAPGVELVTISATSPEPAEPETIEAVGVTNDMWVSGTWPALLRLLPHLSGLRWLHTSSAGVDSARFQDLARRGVTVTNSPGITAVPIAQYVLAMMLRHAKDIPAWEAAQRERAWRRVSSEELTEKSVLILGVGGIGGEVARLSDAFGMRVLGIRRRQEPLPHIHELAPPDRLHHLLREADYLVVACPLTHETRGMLDAAALACLKPSCYIVNVARGAVFDESALIEALQAGRVAGAALDVFDQEPLPEDSPLWTLPNVLVTPHNSGASPRTFERSARILLDNLRRFAAGEPLNNVADFTDIVITEA